MALLLACGCGRNAGSLDPGGLTDSIELLDAGWRVKVLRPTARLTPGDGGCLVATGETYPAEAELEVLAMSTGWAVVDEALSCVSTKDVAEIYRPVAAPPATRRGVVQFGTFRSTFGGDGCPIQLEAIDAGTAIDARAKAHDAQYRGQVVIDHELGLAPLRHLDAEGWSWPWHAGVQLVKQVPAGFVIGGGVVIGPKAILTVKHLGVDSTWCYSREPRSGEAWGSGKFECANIERSVNHPDQVDAAIVELKSPIGPPWAKLASSAVAADAEFFSSRWGSFNRSNLADARVLSVGSSNAFCATTWPAGSTFLTADLIVGPGDSGGPAFSGDQVIGLVHGAICRQPIEPDRHVFIHVPGIDAFVSPWLK